MSIVVFYLIIFIFGLIIMLVIGWQTFNLQFFGYLIPILACLVTVLIFSLIRRG